tara:strand:- start:16555 stop:16794 length:240 start_codon:yes stop_codon:yes gene_type:complete
MVKLGEVVKDSIANFKGTVIARCEYLNGCVRIAIQPKKLKEDGSTIGTEWIDESQLVGHSKKKPMEGPRKAPSKMSLPK